MSTELLFTKFNEFNNCSAFVKGVTSLSGFFQTKARENKFTDHTDPRLGVGTHGEACRSPKRYRLSTMVCVNRVDINEQTDRVRPEVC